MSEMRLALVVRHLPQRLMCPCHCAVCTHSVRGPTSICLCKEGMTFLRPCSLALFCSRAAWEQQLQDLGWLLRVCPYSRPGGAAACRKDIRQETASPIRQAHRCAPAFGGVPVGLIQDDNLVAARRQRYLLLRKHFYLVAHHVDPPATTAASPLSPIQGRHCNDWSHRIRDDLGFHWVPQINWIILVRGIGHLSAHEDMHRHRCICHEAHRPVIWCIQLQDTLFVVLAQQRTRQAENAGSLPCARWPLPTRSNPALFVCIARHVATVQPSLALKYGVEVPSYIPNSIWNRVHAKCILLSCCARGSLTARMMLGMLPSSEMTCRRSTASLLPTMSFTYNGLYFSTCRARSLVSLGHPSWWCSEQLLNFRIDAPMVCQNLCWTHQLHCSQVLSLCLQQWGRACLSPSQRPQPPPWLFLLGNFIAFQIKRDLLLCFSAVATVPSWCAYMVHDGTGAVPAFSPKLHH